MKFFWHIFHWSYWRVLLLFICLFRFYFVVINVFLRVWLSKDQLNVRQQKYILQIEFFFSPFSIKNVHTNQCLLVNCYFCVKLINKTFELRFLFFLSWFTVENVDWAKTSIANKLYTFIQFSSLCWYSEALTKLLMH